MKKHGLVLATSLVLVSFANDGRAHGGGLNAEGCHNNRKTGDYHCHRAPAASTDPRATGSGLSPQTQPKAEPARIQGDTVYYANCSEARAAGAAPVRRGDPGYAKHLDRDNDGVGCE